MSDELKMSLAEIRKDIARTWSECLKMWRTCKGMSYSDEFYNGRLVELRRWRKRFHRNPAATTKPGWGIACQTPTNPPEWRKKKPAKKKLIAESQPTDKPPTL